ncbi:MAG TPA: phospho-N-acetylmuramoyl-pentapeptide-transferase [Candidatus Saccharimonadales bacterium]|jgi:phospho-N-acetylmuramoyl-pentapeptide-transferase|nr:phospho-N-acetylmuramoyl-pentapeptide-transferase [Candidatus Saccharimonadales bacterium]
MSEVLLTFLPQLTTITFLGFIGFMLAMGLTPVYTFFAYRYKFWKVQRTEDSSGGQLTVFTKLHAAKFRRNIPTMAGVIFVFVIASITLIANLDRRQTWLPLAALLGGAAVGLLDDIINLRGLGGGVKGLRAPIKFLMITLVGLALAWFFYYKLGYHDIHVPFYGQFELGWLIIPIFVFVVVAAGNAVNISDGLDGLAGGLSVTAFTAFGIIALLQGNFGIAGFCFTVVGALLSYVWFNIFPARFFMGDVGSFALGTALGVVAMMTDTLFLLPIIGVVFVVEAGSSLLQILSKKYLHRRIFISAPIHHHFEALGWPETKVTMRFWIIAQVAAFLGLIVAIAGGYLLIR